MSQSLSLYQDRLSKLVDGYNKNIIDAPDDISYCIFNFIFCSDDSKLMLQKVNDGNNRFDGVEFEIFMEPFLARVIDYSQIKEYKVRYKQEKIKSEDSANNVTTKRIYNDGIAFMDLKLEMDWESYGSTWWVQASGMATDDNILIQSEWIDVKINPYLPYMLYATDKTTNEYFNEYIDINNHESIDIDDWILAVSEMEEMQEFTKLELKRIFYYIVQYHANGKANEEDNQEDDVSWTGKIDAKNFHDFITCEEYDILENYSEVYRRFITLVRAKVPELLKKGDYL